MGIFIAFVRLLTPLLEAGSAISTGDFGDWIEFVGTFLLTEAISFVTSEEYSCSIACGYHLAWLSEPFGVTEYPEFRDCEVLRRVQSCVSFEDLQLLVERGEGTFTNAPFEPVVAQ